MDLTQIVTDPALCTQLQQLQTFNLLPYAGLAGAPAIEQVVQYFREQWALPVKLAPIVALVIGVVVNVAVSPYTGSPLEQAVFIGLLTGATASGWYVVTK